MADHAKRRSTEERQAQIAHAALDLLADTPVAALSTRDVARAVGISQPALFRHFRSRDAILEAAIRACRAELGTLAESIVSSEQPAIDKLAAIAAGLLEQVEQHPGLPRLLFSDSHPDAGPVRLALKQLVSMQQALATELVRQAQRQGAVRQDIEAPRAATLFVGFVQGVVLQWQMADRNGSLSDEATPLFALWLDGVRARGEAAARDGSAQAVQRAAESDAIAAGPGELVSLDLRPILARGADPLQDVLAALPAVGADGLLVLRAPFRPAPLIALLSSRGFCVSATPLDAGEWCVEACAPGAPAVEDLRDLEPPEPLERLLTLGAALQPGAVALARTPHFPRLLLPRLQERGLRWAVHEAPDGSALVMLRAAR